jgi:putative membrane protein
MSRKKKGIVVSIQSAQTEVVEMTRSFFTAPSPVKVLLPIILLSYLSGFLLSGLSEPIYGLYYGTLLFLLPTVLTAVISKPVSEALGGRFNIRRSFLMSAIDLGVVFLLVFVKVLLFRNVETASYLILAFASTTWLRHVVLVSTSNSSHLLSLPSTIIYFVVGVLLTAYIFPPFGQAHLLLAIILPTIFIVVGVLFLTNANRPLKKAFGINGLKMLGYFLDQKKSKKETMNIESLFESFSSPVSAHVGILSFKTRDGIKALMIVPSIHPGPFGLLGGSNLPSKLRGDLASNASVVMVPHGPCNHDFNPPTSKECGKISAKVKELLNEVEYSDVVGRFERKLNHANVSVQNFGGSGLALVSLAPNPTDDLDFSTGYAIREKIKDAGYNDALVIDAHNCLSPGSGMVHFGSKISMSIIETAELSARESLMHTGTGLRAGASERGDLGIGSMGPMGIQVLALETGGQKIAYILLDGNNMVPELREEILFGLKGMVDEAEVLTTDNHVANITFGSFNPVGMQGRKEIVELAREHTSKALEDMEQAQVGLKTGMIEDFKVFGQESATRLATLISSTVSTLRISAILCLIVAYSLSALTMIFIA